MPDNRNPFTIGVEEEYLLVDPVSRELVSDPGAQSAVLSRLDAEIGADIGFGTKEFLRAQVEVGTAVCESIPELRDCLRRLRGAVAAAADSQGLAFIAASTHPTAVATNLEHSDGERYDALADDLQEVARRMVICGMHVHVGVDDPEHRIDLLGQLAYFLPHLLVLSTSSPFWEGRDTGLKCYRLSVFDELPRTGLPERFDSWNDYERHVSALTTCGAIEDSSKIWWDIRPHGTFPTLEMRVADVCTYLEDGLAVASLYLCIVGMLQRLRRSNQRWRSYANMLIDENRWRAQRYGADEGLIDFGVGVKVPYSDLLDELVEMVAPEMQIYGCVDELIHARTIVERGTSADQQRKTYQAAIDSGASVEDALKAVVDWMIEASVQDL